MPSSISLRISIGVLPRISSLAPNKISSENLFLNFSLASVFIQVVVPGIPPEKFKDFFRKSFLEFFTNISEIFPGVLPDFLHEFLSQRAIDGFRALNKWEDEVCTVISLGTFQGRFQCSSRKKFATIISNPCSWITTIWDFQLRFAGISLICFFPEFPAE